jgi:hypothetical protein
MSTGINHTLGASFGELADARDAVFFDGYVRDVATPACAIHDQPIFDEQVVGRNGRSIAVRHCRSEQSGNAQKGAERNG